MLDDSAFLRRVPDFFDGEHAVHLDALVFASDAVAISMESLREHAAAYKDLICKAPRAIHTKMLMDVWTVIDSLHVVRELLEAMDYKTESGPKFCEDFAAASHLRNKMDHLHQNAKNVSTSKRRPPVFGALAYLCVADDFVRVVDGVVSVEGVGSVVITAGRIKDQKFTMLNPMERQFAIPVSNFFFEAFDQTIDLDKAEIALDNLVNEFNNSLDLKATEFAKAYAQEHKKDLDELLSAPPSSIAAYMPMRFVPVGDLAGELKPRPIKIDFTPSTYVRVSLTQRPAPKR